MTEREQFEAWAIKENFAFRDEQGFWGLGESVGTMWRIWQAARATPAEQSAPVAWFTDHTKDNKQTLVEGIVASNKAYIEAHSEWVWEPLVKKLGELA